MTATPPLLAPGEAPAAEIHGADRQGGLVICCEHASNRIPAALAGLGLDAMGAISHAAWDPGALALSLRLGAALEAPVIAARVSRLVHDLNRPDGTPEAMPAQVERITVPGNREITEAQRDARVAEIATPFHDMLAGLLDARPGAALVTVHSFTPLWHGEPREVELGLLHDDDDRLARAVAAHPGLAPAPRLNEPYGPADGVTHMLRRHALPRGIPNLMLEIRNDLLETDAQVAGMARALAPAIAAGLARVRCEDAA